MRELFTKLLALPEQDGGSRPNLNGHQLIFNKLQVPIKKHWVLIDT